MRASTLQLDAILRQDFLSFVAKVFETVSGADDFEPNWHIEAMAYQLLRCLSGDIRRLAMFVPPRHLKSIVTSVAFCAWALGQDPKLRIVVVSHTYELATALTRQFRQVVESDWYRRAFPRMRVPRKATETEYVTAEGGMRLAVSVGGSITGRGGDIIIVDDPMKAELANSEAEEARVRTWCDGTLSTRLNNKKRGVMILVTQRLSVGDLATHLVGPNWTTLRIPAIADHNERIPLPSGRDYSRKVGDLLHPLREGPEEYEDLRRQLGAAGFEAQYQQAPVPFGGGMIPLEWFGRFSKLPSRNDWETTILSWDTAISQQEGASFSVGQFWVVMGNKIYLCGQFRDRLLYPRLREKVKQSIERLQPDYVLIENASSGAVLYHDVLDHFRRTRGLREGLRRVRAMRPARDKEDRVAEISPMIEAGEVVIPNKVDFSAEFEAEIRAFPSGRYDDQVDAMSQTLKFWRTLRNTRPPRSYGIPLR